MTSRRPAVINWLPQGNSPVPPMLVWLIRTAIATAALVALISFWWQGVLGEFFHGLATIPPSR